MAFLLFAIAVVLVAGTGAGVALLRSRLEATAERPAPPSPAALRTETGAIIDSARAEALAVREAAADEISARRAAMEAREAALAERERSWRDRRAIFDERRLDHRRRQEEMDGREADLTQRHADVRRTVAQRATLERDQAQQMVLEALDAELEVERPARVAARLTDLTGEPQPAARTLIVSAMERQATSHVDTAPRLAPLALEGLDPERRERVVTALQVVAESTGTELGVDEERQQATLRGLDPIARETARQASLEVLDRSLQAAAVPPLLLRTRRKLSAAVTEIGERALWEMAMEGRPELAELMGVLHYRFSYGQNALLHCKETGNLCAVLAAELGMTQADARQAGMLHDIGKAVDHDVEGSHAIIGGELLRVMGAEPGIVHAVKAHHFDEEPATDLAMLVICADAISASRPGARRDTLAAYLARLEQLQEIATRHHEVERAFPLQAGRELRVFVRAQKVADAEMPALSGEIAREIEGEMQYPGVIKITVIRETQANATAPVQVGRAARAPEPALVGAGPKRRRRRRRRKGGAAGDGETPTEAG
ncbi:MAG TPA: HDIG domain-containing protein [Candidatus Binatia bacterium]|nr:HDIG domain-containing protein [Candidatus Binatia bacterium]